MRGNDVLELLRKLVSHERSARDIGNIQEADAFAGKIQELLSKHKLGMSDVEFADREANEPIEWLYVDPQEAGYGRNKKGRVPWQIYLANSIADANTCRVVLAGGNRLYFVGRTSDRELCKMFFLYLLELAKELAEKDAIANMAEQRRLFSQENGYEAPSRMNKWDTRRVRPFDSRKFLAWMQDYRKAWYNGFGGVVGNRIEEKTAAAREQANPNAIVHIDRDKAAVDEEVDNNSKSAKFGGTLGRNELAMMRGAAAGSNVALTPHVFKRDAQTSHLLGAGK